MAKWVKDNSSVLKNEVRAKLYVGITRARHSAAIVVDYNHNDTYEGIMKYSMQTD